jgi:hypothetical protein
MGTVGIGGLLFRKISPTDIGDLSFRLPQSRNKQLWKQGQNLVVNVLAPQPFRRMGCSLHDFKIVKRWYLTLTGAQEI